MQPAGDAAAVTLAGVRPSPADLADAALWEGAGRGAERLRRRLLLRGLAAAVLDVHVDTVEVAREPAGRPRIAAPLPAFVSVARRGAWAALALAVREVGVDLEAPAADAPLPPGEVASLRTWRPGVAAPQALVAGWAAREAYLKASGAGLAGADALRLLPVAGGLEIEGPRGRAAAHLREVDGLVAAAVLL